MSNRFFFINFKRKQMIILKIRHKTSIEFKGNYPNIVLCKLFFYSLLEENGI